jgi:hypothetical protein
MSQKVGLRGGENLLDFNFVCSSSVARGGAMGHLHPPSPNCLALDKIEVSNFLYKSLILRGIFRQKY